MPKRPRAAVSVATTDAPVAKIPGNAPPTSRPDFKRPEYVDGKPARDLCHALMAGTAGIRALGDVGLPKWPAEKQANYNLRAKMTQVTRYYQRTVQASVGMICATPPALAEDADQLIKDDWEDIDGRGTHGEVFAKHVATDAINGGFCGILVDSPPWPDGVALRHDQYLALGLRPFWVSVPADRVVSWVVDAPQWMALLAAWQGGQLSAEQVKAFAKQTIVRQLVLHEPTDVVSGTFGMVCVDRYRVLALTETGVSFRVWEKRKPDGNSGSTTGEYFALVNEGEMTQAKQQPFREIPFAVVYAGRPTAPFVAEPPLLGLAELNLDHYQVSADRRYLMRLCHAPTLFLAGVESEIDESGRAKPIEVGPNSVLVAKDPTAKATYVAANPDALKSSQEEKLELVSQMATLGMSFIGKDRRTQAETATGRALDDAAENASHATVARGLQDGFEQALKFHAAYRGVKAPEITVNTSYASAQVDPQIAAVLWQAVAADKLPIEAFVEYLTTGQLPDDLADSVEILRQIQNEQANNDAAAAAERAKATVDPANQPNAGGSPSDGTTGMAVGGKAMAAK